MDALKSSYTRGLGGTDSIDARIEELHPLIGFETSDRFEEHIASAATELAKELEARILDSETTINYATYVFAKILDELSEILNHPPRLN